MRLLAIIEKQESFEKLLQQNFFESRNNILVICDEKVEHSSVICAEYLDVAQEIILQREHEQQHRYFEKMFNKPSFSLRFLIPSTPSFIKKHVYKHDFLTQKKLWAYLWPQYRKELMVNSKKKYSSFTYYLSVLLLPRVTAFFAYALIIKTKVPLLIKRKLGLKFSEAEFSKALMHRIDFHDPDIIFCDSDRLDEVAKRLNLCPVHSLATFIENGRGV